jgi:hypothetical protein
MNLRGRIDRLGKAMAPAPVERPRFIETHIGRHGVDYSHLGFRDTSDDWEVVVRPGGHYLVMVRLPEAADLEDCHLHMTQDQLRSALFAHRLHLHLGPPRRQAGPGEPPITSIFDPSRIKRRFPQGESG